MSLLDEVTSITTTEDKAQQAKEAARNAAQAKRNRDLHNMTHTFADGRVVQVRPSDLPNFQTAIAQNKDRTWVMADNTTAIITVTELNTAMQSGIEQAETIWDEYIAALEANNAG